MKSKQIWKVAAALILCPLAMFLFSLTLPKRYTASMMLLVDQTFRAVTTRSDNPLGDQLEFSRARPVPTQIDMITGSDVLLKAIEMTAVKHPNAFVDSSKNAERYQSLANRLRVDVNRESEVIQLRVTMDEPVLAADTANNIGYAFIEKAREISAQAGTSAYMRLDEKIKRDEERLLQLETRIKDVKAEYGIADLTFGTSNVEKLSSEMELQVAHAESEANAAAAELIEAEAYLSRTPTYLKSQETVSYNPEILNIESQITRLEAELGAARERYTDKHPRVVELANSLNTLKQRRQSMPDRIQTNVNESLNPNYTSAQSAVAMARARLASSQQRVGRLRAELQTQNVKRDKYPEAQTKLSALELDRDALKGTHAQNLQLRDRLDMTRSGRESQARIVSMAYPPMRPSFPNTRLFILMGLAIGIVISALIVMPKAPEIVYTPVPADALSLNVHRTEVALPATGVAEEQAAKPAIGQGGQQ